MSDNTVITASPSSGNSSGGSTLVDTKDTATTAGPIRDWFDGDHRLIRHARRLRHIKRIVFRNLNSVKIPVDCFFTLTLEGETKPFFISAVAEETLNPYWDKIRKRTFTEPSLLFCTKFLFSLYWKRDRVKPSFERPSSDAFSPRLSQVPPVLASSAIRHNTQQPPSAAASNGTLPDGTPRVEEGLPAGAPRTIEVKEGDSSDVRLAHYTIDLLQLERIHSLDFGTLPVLPPNTVLFAMTDGLYAVKLVADVLRVSSPLAAIADKTDNRFVKKIDVNEVLEWAGKQLARKAAIRKAEQDIAELSRQIHEKLQAAQAAAEKVRQAKQRGTRLAQLAAAVDTERKSLDRERKRVHKKRLSLLPRSRQVMEQSRMLIKHREQLEEERKKLLTLKKIALRTVEMKVASRQRKLISTLLTVYPLSRPLAPVPNKEGGPQMALSERQFFSIRGLPLPTWGLHAYDDEVISTALGHVGHLIFMLSKYMAVPLRYPILFRASRSVVCDNVQGNTEFPLFCKSTEQKQFEAGVHLLNKNIEHLLNVRLENWQKMAQGTQHTLENLHLLLNHECPS